MNFLTGTSCYLIGAIEHDKDFGCGWRNQIVDKLKDYGIKFYNPLDRPEWLKCIEKYTPPNIDRSTILQNIEENKNIEWSKCQTLVRKVCLRYVATCDFAICYLNDGKTYGTIEELVRLNDLGKPILIICDEIPSLCLYDVIKDQYMFKNIDILIQFLSNIHSGSQSVDALRWIFLGDNYDKSIDWKSI